MRLADAERQFPDAFAMIEARARELEGQLHAGIDFASASIADTPAGRMLRVLAFSDGVDDSALLLSAPLDGPPDGASVH